MKLPTFSVKDIASTVIKGKRDRLKRIRYRPGKGTSAGAARIRELQLAVIKGALNHESLPTRLAASIMLFDGVVPSKLASAAACIDTRYHYNKACLIEWNDEHGRLDVRELSLFTRHLLQGSSQVPAEDIVSAARSLSSAIYPHADDPIKAFEADLTAWAFETFSGHTFAHVTGDDPITPISREARARGATGLALVAQNGEITSSSANALGAALDHAYQSKTLYAGTSLVTSMQAICRTNSRKNDAQDRSSMLAELCALSHRVSEVDTVSAVLLAWHINLVESGTSGTDSPQPKTLYEYSVRLVHNAHRIALKGESMRRKKSTAATNTGSPQAPARQR